MVSKSPKQELRSIKKYTRDGRSPTPGNETISRVMSSNRAKDTKPELLLRKALWNHGIKGYRLHWKKVPGRPDIAFPGRKIGIFVNGCFWHRCPFCNLPYPKTNIQFWVKKFERNQQRDREKVDQLHSLGWRTITIWECQLKDDKDLVIQAIRKTL